MLVDTHLHLGWLDDAAAAVAEAGSAGVAAMISVGVDLDDSRRCLELASVHPEVFAGVGHHPTNRFPPDWEAISELAVEPRVVVVGEVGIDLLGDDREPESVQREWLHQACALALELGLPVSIHTRESAAAVHDVISAHPGLTGVMHYFALDWGWAERFLDLGFHLSFSGLVTRPSRDALREVARRCPADRLLLETDAPYGSPHGRVKEPNRPAWVVETATLVAGLRGITLEALAEQEARNAAALFTRLEVVID